MTPYLLVKAFQPISLSRRNDSYSDSLYVLHSILTLAVVPILGYENFHIVSRASNPDVTIYASHDRVTPNERGSLSTIY